MTLITNDVYRSKKLCRFDVTLLAEKYLTSKIIFIKLQKNNLNLQFDTDYINQAYIDIFSEL